MARINYNSSDFKSKTNTINANMHRAAPDIIKNAAIDVIYSIQPNVPLDKGALMDKRYIEQSGFNSRYIATIVYSSKNKGFDYAKIQEDRTDFKHKIQGKAHYVSDTMKNSEQVIINKIASGVRQVLQS